MSLPTREIIEAFIIRNCVDVDAANSLRDQRPDVQQEVLARGDVHRHRNPSAALQKHIKEAKLLMNSMARSRHAVALCEMQQFNPVSGFGFSDPLYTYAVAPPAPVVPVLDDRPAAAAPRAFAGGLRRQRSFSRSPSFGGAAWRMRRESPSPEKEMCVNPIFGRTSGAARAGTKAGSTGGEPGSQPPDVESAAGTWDCSCRRSPRRSRSRRRSSRQREKGREDERRSRPDDLPKDEHRRGKQDDKGKEDTRRRGKDQEDRRRVREEEPREDQDGMQEEEKRKAKHEEPRRFREAGKSEVRRQSLSREEHSNDGRERDRQEKPRDRQRQAQQLQKRGESGAQCKDEGPPEVMQEIQELRDEDEEFKRKMEEFERRQEDRKRRKEEVSQQLQRLEKVQHGGKRPGDPQGSGLASKQKSRVRGDAARAVQEASKHKAQGQCDSKRRGP